MNQLVNLDRVPFVLTTFTGVALAAQPIAAQNSVVLMNIGVRLITCSTTLALQQSDSWATRSMRRWLNTVTARGLARRRS